MTLGQFRKATADYSDEMELYVDERVTDFRYGMVETVEKKEIGFSEEPGGENLCKYPVLVISEEE